VWSTLFLMPAELNMCFGKYFGLFIQNKEHFLIQEHLD